MTALALSSHADFWREWLRNPLRVAAVAPSSAGLAKAISLGLGVGKTPVVELGPGTGVFTRQLIAQGVPPRRIAAVEASERFATRLSRRFPDLIVLQGDAARVKALVPFQAGSVNAVVCGLPLLSMPQAQVYRIMRGSFDLLSAGGEFRLFTYGPKCPVPSAIKARLGLRSDPQSFVALNMPPATVYTLRRQGD